MFTFQITFKSEVCGPEPQFGGNKIPLAAASCIWKSFAKRDRVCYLGKLDVLWERDEVTLAFPQAADVRKELQARASSKQKRCLRVLSGGGGMGVPQRLLSSARRRPRQEPGERRDPNGGSDFQKLFHAITDASAGCANWGCPPSPALYPPGHVPLPGLTGDSICRRKGDGGNSCFSDVGLESVTSGCTISADALGALRVESGTQRGKPCEHRPGRHPSHPAAGRANCLLSVPSSDRRQEGWVMKDTLHLLLWKSNFQMSQHCHGASSISLNKSELHVSPILCQRLCPLLIQNPVWFVGDTLQEFLFPCL